MSKYCLIRCSTNSGRDLVSSKQTLRWKEIANYKNSVKFSGTKGVARTGAPTRTKTRLRHSQLGLFFEIFSQLGLFTWGALARTSDRSSARSSTRSSARSFDFFLFDDICKKKPELEKPELSQKSPSWQGLSWVLARVECILFSWPPSL